MPFAIRLADAEELSRRAPCAVGRRHEARAHLRAERRGEDEALAPAFTAVDGREALTVLHVDAVATSRLEQVRVELGPPDDDAHAIDRLADGLALEHTDPLHRHARDRDVDADRREHVESELAHRPRARFVPGKLRLVEDDDAMGPNALVADEVEGRTRSCRASTDDGDVVVERFRHRSRSRPGRRYLQALPRGRSRARRARTRGLLLRRS